MSTLRIISIGFAAAALLVLIASWLGWVALEEKLIIIFPLLILAIIFKYLDFALKKR